MQQKEYTKPSIEIVTIEAEDVIVTSGGLTNGGTLNNDPSKDDFGELFGGK